MSDSTSTPNYPALTRRILDNIDPSSPSLTYRAIISDILTPLFNPPFPSDQMTYLALVLSIETQDLAKSSNITIAEDELQMKFDMAPTGSACRAELRVARQVESYVVLRGPEGEYNVGAMRLFVDEVERIGHLVIAEWEAGDTDAEGEDEE